MRAKIISALVILCVLIAVLDSRAATSTAASCSFIDVSNAVQSATTGDTILIPAGNCIWTNALTTTKRLALVGAGMGSTIIRDHKTENSYLITMAFSSGNSTFCVKVAHMTISAGTNSAGVINSGGLNSTQTFRFHNLQITNLVIRGIVPQGWTLNGVIDHCQFSGHASGLGAPTMISPFGLGTGSQSGLAAPTTNPTWDTIPFMLGSTQLVTIENCGFWTANGVQNGAMDAYNGARFIFRHNNITNCNVGAHGTDSSGSARGAHTFECYANFFTNSLSVIPFSFRGGTGLFYSNTVLQSSGAAANFVRIDNYKSSGTNIYPVTAPIGCCAPYGPTTATNIYGGGFEFGTNGYPGYDQIGRTSPTTYTETNTVQILQPTYQWSNTFNGALGLPYANGTPYTNTGDYAHIPPSTVIIVENRDYYNNVVYDYTPLVYPHPLVTAQDVTPYLPSSVLRNATLGGNVTVR